MDYRILGPLQVRAEPGGEPCVVTGRRRRAVLGFFLVHPNTVVTRDRIIEAVWRMHPAESDGRMARADRDEMVTDASARRASASPCPMDASRTLRNVVCDLRKALGDSDHPSILLTCPGGYRLVVHAGELDADRFEGLKDRAQRALKAGHPQDALDAAAELWRGDPFGDLAYEEFAQAKIKELHDSRNHMDRLRAQSYLQTGRLTEAVSLLQRLLLDAPTDEDVAGMLMLALYGCGRQTDADAVYVDVRARLDVRGMLPCTALRRRHDQIVGHDPELARGEGPFVTAISLEPDPEQGAEGLPRPFWPASFAHRFVVGRSQELLVARRCLDAFARHDRGGIERTLAGSVVFEEAAGDRPIEHRGVRAVTARLLRLASYFEAIRFDIREPTARHGVLRYDISWSAIQVRPFEDGTTAGDAGGVVRELGHIVTTVKHGVITHIRYGGYRDTTFDGAR